MNPTYQLVEDDKVTGPHSLAVLRQKAEIRVIRPDTPVRAVVHPPEAWRLIRDCPELHDQLFVATTAPKLAVATRYQATNAKTDAESAPVDVIQILRANAAHERAATRRSGPTLLTIFLVLGSAAALIVLAYLLSSYLHLLPFRFPR